MGNVDRTGYPGRSGNPVLTGVVPLVDIIDRSELDGGRPRAQVPRGKIEDPVFHVGRFSAMDIGHSSAAARRARDRFWDAYGRYIPADRQVVLHALAEYRQGGGGAFMDAFIAYVGADGTEARASLESQRLGPRPTKSPHWRLLAGYEKVRDIIIDLVGAGCITGLGALNELLPAEELGAKSSQVNLLFSERQRVLYLLATVDLDDADLKDEWVLSLLQSAQRFPEIVEARPWLQELIRKAVLTG